MTERPIIFNSEMVRATLDGRKTHTRRPIKPQPEQVGDGFLLPLKIECPFGVPGDRLWVRETFWDYGPNYGLDRLRVAGYFADVGEKFRTYAKKVPSIHMPRWASRITLEITNISVERVQEIRGKDIVAEGAVIGPHTDNFGRNPISAFDGKVYLDLRSLWVNGWESLYGQGAWERNDWVWVIEFKLLEGK